MKKLSVSLLALTVALVAAPVVAHADQTPGWYVGAGVGGSQTLDSTVTTAPAHSKVYFDPGFDVNGNGGYSWDNGLRLEGEVWHSRADVDAVHGAGSSNGHLSNTDLFGNAYYDFHTGTMLTPYVGAGLGVAYIDSNHIGTFTTGTAPDFTNSSINGGNINMAYQGIVGAAMQLDHNWAVTADYRYVATLDPKVHSSTGRGVYEENASHNIVVGVRYSFDCPPTAPVRNVATPMTPAAPMAAKPVVAPIPQSFMVFFDFNKAVLTPEAKKILASAADEFKRGGYVKIVVTGHTDTVGSNKYNQTLSEHRAAAVKAELDRLGVEAHLVKAVGAGKNGLLVPTADGVREAQNRRAEVVFDKQ